MKIKEIAAKYNLDKAAFESFVWKQSEVKTTGLSMNIIADEDVPKIVDLYNKFSGDAKKLQEFVDVYKTSSIDTMGLKEFAEAKEGIEEEKEKQKEADKENARHNTQQKFKPTIRGAVFHVDGSRGRSLDVFPNKCIISVDATLGALVTGNATDGEKTIYYGDCIGLQYKRAGVILGYLQLETATSAMNNNQSNLFNENTFTYDENKISNSEMDVIVDYVKAQVENVKVRMYGDGRD